LQSFRATWVKACGPTRFLGGATGKHNQKMHGEKTLGSAFHHACSRGATTEDIAVKLVKRKLRTNFEAKL
jgi:hypothetical protein